MVRCMPVSRLCSRIVDQVLGFWHTRCLKHHIGDWIEGLVEQDSVCSEQSSLHLGTGKAQRYALVDLQRMMRAFVCSHHSECEGVAFTLASYCSLELYLSSCGGRSLYKRLLDYTRQAVCLSLGAECCYIERLRDNHLLILRTVALFLQPEEALWKWIAPSSLSQQSEVWPDLWVCAFPFCSCVLSSQRLQVSLSACLIASPLCAVFPSVGCFVPRS